MANRYEPTGKTCLVTGGAKRIRRAIAALPLPLRSIKRGASFLSC